MSCTFDSPELLLKKRLLSYLENAPKKCFFSVYNYMVSKESTLIVFKNAPKIKTMIALYKEKVEDNDNPMTWEEFKEFFLNHE